MKTAPITYFLFAFTLIAWMSAHSNFVQQMPLSMDNTKAVHCSFDGTNSIQISSSNCQKCHAPTEEASLVSLNSTYQHQTSLMAANVHNINSTQCTSCHQMKTIKESDLMASLLN